METFLYIVFFISCLLLIVSVLLQPGKTDAGALFTSNISSAAMNPRGTQSVLSKLTIAMAAIFILTALLLSLPAITGNVSVLETEGQKPSPSPAADQQNANVPANSNAADTTAPGNTAQPASNAAAEEKGSADEAKPASSDEKKESDKPKE